MNIAKKCSATLVRTSVQFVAFSLTVCLCCLASGEEKFEPGTVIKEYGKLAKIDSDFKIPAGMKFKVRFDVERGGRGAINQGFDMAARLINLQAASGIAAEDTEIAVVVHGSAALDVVTNEFSENSDQAAPNASAKLIEVLQKHNVKFYICGQTIVYRDIKKENLLPGIVVAPSAMTVHAVLAQQGFTLNPF